MDEVIVEPSKPTFVDELVKGMISLVAGAIMTQVVDKTYDKFVVARRNQPVVKPVVSE